MNPTVDAVDGPTPLEAGPGGSLFWSGVAIGWAVMAVGALVMIDDPDGTNPPGLARWLIGGLLVHDLVVAPLATAVALVIARHAARWWAGPVTAALALSAIVVGFSYPLLRGFGRRDANLSALPRDYPGTVGLVVAVIWAVAAVVLTRRRWSR